MNREAAVVKVVNGVARVYNERGVYLFSLGNGMARSAEMSGEAIAVEMENGTIRIYDLQGRYVRSLV